MNVRVSVQATSHGNDVHIDRDARTAPIGAGVRWDAILQHAAVDLAPVLPYVVEERSVPISCLLPFRLRLRG